MITPERLDTLVLARLSVGDTKLTSARESLGRLVETHLSPGAWREAFAATVSRLTERGWLADGTPTPRGRRALAAALRVEELPTVRRWESMLSLLLAPVALGHAPTAAVRRKLGAPERLRAATLAAAHRLPLETPTLTRAIDALIWRELGVERDTPVTLAALRRLMLHRALGTPERLPPKTQAAIAASASVGASGRDARSLCKALVLRWLQRGDATTAEEPPLPPDDMSAFVARLARAARSTEVARWGRDKVFIASLFDAVRGDGDAHTELGAFKERLVAAQREGLLELARADLVAAMDQSLVARSETRYLNSAFHFLVAPMEARV